MNTTTTLTQGGFATARSLNACPYLATWSSRPHRLQSYRGYNYPDTGGTVGVQLCLSLEMVALLDWRLGGKPCLEI